MEKAVDTGGSADNAAGKSNRELRAEQDMRQQKPHVIPNNLVRLHFESLGKGEDRRRRRDLFLQARQCYMQEYGTIRKESYLGATEKGPGKVSAACVYTDDGFLYLWFDRSHPHAEAIEDLIYRLDRLSDEAMTLPRTKARRTLLDRIANCAGAALSLWSHVAATPPGKVEQKGLAKQVAMYRKETDHVEQLYKRLATREAKVTYLSGTLAGLGVVVAIWYFLWDRIPPVAYHNLVAGVFLMGAVGTALSVMTRLPRDAVRLDIRDGFDLMFAFGFLRPLIGGIFGAMLYVLALGDWIPLELPADAAVVPAFFAGGAFVMGFSERLARDMMVVAGRRLEPGAKEDPETKGKKEAEDGGPS